ncbi:putative RING-H2 finger protein ATL21A [Lotus japonicus]|uniref:putative RING-H2 finger protein ATL21A n=1 Tax=Lotus japonicus TaxID=34305 RepID=UPI0025885CDC|nr:putative RING-H2 finger protein ATL21A [Lotus japonicus]
MVSLSTCLFVYMKCTLNLNSTVETFASSPSHPHGKARPPPLTATYHHINLSIHHLTSPHHTNQYSHPLNHRKMTTLPSFFSLFTFTILILSATSETEPLCKTTSCEPVGLPIQFPFSLRNSNQSLRCGSPGFELSCTNTRSQSQPLITLPESGDFVVKLISLVEQRIWINDPDNCLPQRIMRDRGLNLEGSPFRISDYYTLVDFSFFNCPSNITSSPFVDPITCLNSSSVYNSSDGNGNYSVVAMMTDPPFPTAWVSSCDLITTAKIPVDNMPWLFWTDYNSDIPLQWDNPDCRSCEARGGRCGFRDEHDVRVSCDGLPSQSQGFSSKTKYAMGMGLGIPGLLGLIGLAWIFCCKKNSGPQPRQTGTELSTLIIPHPLVVTMGLDGAAIERYPKTQLGESGRLPRPNDNTCSICLSEYQPMETLRTIPECNHYFHANCIDGWLKMNATCPLCRNLPERSPSFAPSLPLSQTSQQLSM